MTPDWRAIGDVAMTLLSGAAAEMARRSRRHAQQARQRVEDTYTSTDAAQVEIARISAHAEQCEDRLNRSERREVALMELVAKQWRPLDARTRAGDGPPA